MFTIPVKDNSPDLEVFVSRAMLLLAALATITYPASYYFISIFCGVTLFIAALLVKKIFKLFKINQFFLFLFAAILLVIATHSFLFAILFIIFGKMVKYLYHSPEIIFNTEEVVIKKTLGSKHFKWTKFNNIILKDNLLSLDFVNNTLIQVNLADNAAFIDEKLFNEFCNKQLVSIG